MSGAIPPGALAELVDRLSHVRSPVERMRLLARSWKHLRALDREERRRLAEAVGVDGAERLIERIARRRVPVAEIVRSLASDGGSDPDRPSSILDELADSDGRRAIARRGRDMIVERLAGTTTSDGVVLPATDLERLEQDSGRPPPKPEPPSEPEEPPEPEVAAAEPAVVLPPPEPEVAAAEPAVVLPPPARPVEAPEPMPTAAIPTGHPDDPGAWLRALRADLAKGPAAISRDELRDRIARADRSWVRRRAVVAAIDAGAVWSLDDLAAILDLVDRPSDRRWCTLRLLDRGVIAPDALRRLAAEHPDPTVRRRASRRVRA